MTSVELLQKAEDIQRTIPSGDYEAAAKDIRKLAEILILCTRALIANKGEF